MADSADRHRGVLVHVVLPLLEGADFPLQRQERLRVLLCPLCNVLRGGAERCTVHVRAGVDDVAFRIRQRVEAVLPAEGLAAHHLHALLHVPLLVA